MRRILVVVLAGCLCWPVGVTAAPSAGAVEGTVTVNGRPLSGIDLSLVSLDTGAIHTARTAADGSYSLDLAPGPYVLTGRSAAGLAVGRAPVVVKVQPGQVASANLEMVALAVPYPQEPPTAPSGEGVAIQHDPVGCLVAGEFPILDATFTPAASVARARLYFKSSLAPDWYYVEMVQQPAGGFRGWMPRPQVAASPISYYIQAATTEFGENQTPEISAIVVDDESQCGDRKVAPFGQPPAGLTVFSATTGASVTIPAGFAAGGLALGAGAIALIAAGATAAGVGISQATGGTPTPTPTPTPTVLPPTPTPTPPLRFILTVLISPPGFGTVEINPNQGSYDAGTVVTLTAATLTIPASPPEIVRFVRWDGGCEPANVPVCTVTMNSNVVITAVFTSEPAPLRRP